MKEQSNQCPEVLRYADEILAGQTAHSLANRVASNELIRLRPGHYVRAAEVVDAFPDVKHLLTVQSAIGLCSDGTVLSHVSAAVMHGLPIWGIDSGKVHVTKPRPSGGHVAPGLHTHCQPMEQADVVTLDGLPVTSAARTVVDVLRCAPFEQGVVVADAALRRGLVSGEELAGQVELAQHRRGIAMARRVLAFADGRSESVGESRSRVLMYRSGLVVPDLQVEIRGFDDRVIARADFGIEAVRWAGEFDGLVKYGRLRLEGETEGDAVTREKRREDLVRDQQWLMLRWVWAELSRPALLKQRMVQSFKSAHLRLR